jgi:Na+-translocating ferredoxin:NAD+ oxidoreductase RnfG subunit
MWFLDTCSDRVLRRRACLIAFAVLPLLAAGRAHAQATLTQEDALRLAFPAPLRVERRTAFLDDAQLRRVRELAKAEHTQRVVTYYAATDAAGRAAGVAYFDSHRVRTLGEVLMFVVDTESRIRRVEVLRFAEPPEYQAPDRWLALFHGRSLSPDLSLKRAIPNITGATLTANAVTLAARRVLALHSVIHPAGAR